MTATNSTSAGLLASLVLFVLVRCVCPAPTSPVSSGETIEVSSSSMENPESLAKNIVQETNDLYIEFCKTHIVCGSSMERHLRKELKLPEITVSDGCLSLGFNKEKCLNKIHHDLRRFQIYLEFLKESFKSKNQAVEFIQLKTQILSETVERMLTNPSKEKEESNRDITVDLKTEDTWNEKLTTYIILQSFKDYMVKTSRAVRNNPKKRM